MQSYKSNVDQLSSVLENVDSQGNVIAPISGTVVTLNAVEDGYVSASLPVAVIDGAEQMEISVSVSEALVPKLAIGDEAEVYVSALNCPDEKGLLKGLKSAAGYLRRELGSRIDLRYTPELQFFVDDSIAYGAHILDMLNHVKPADPRNADIVLPEDREG